MCVELGTCRARVVSAWVYVCVLCVEPRTDRARVVSAHACVRVCEHVFELGTGRADMCVCVCGCVCVCV